jgi:uncharacterized protein with HEPN domain
MKKSRRGNIDFSSMLSPKARAVRELVAKMPPLPAPPTVRECAAQGLSPSALTPRRTSMSPAHTRELVERYPGLYRHADDKPVSSCEPFAREGFACGDGWFAIVDRLSSRLVADPNLVVSQFKEKMGLLRVYFDTGELANPATEAATDAAYDEAREESRRTCEVCGDSGTHQVRSRGWWSVRCEPCAWLDDMEEAGRHLADCAEGLDLAAFAATENRPDAARFNLRHVGEAASYQSPERRARLPGIAWERLDTFRPQSAVMAMSAAELFAFIRDEVPALAEALQ